MVVAEAVERLKKIAILAEAGDDTLGEIARSLSWRTVNPGEEVVTHLSSETGVHFISEGTFRVRLEPAPGSAVAIRQLQPGQHFGEIAALTGAPRSVTVTAATAGIVAYCPQEAFLAAMTTNPAISRAVAASLARTVVTLTDRLFEVAALEVRFRIYAELIRLAKSGQPIDGGVLIADAPTHDMIASAVGTHREAVTKELRYLTSRKVLRQDRRELTLLDLPQLRELVHKRAGPALSRLLDW
jgi:CRP/FNR family transcriptional regulator, cyclic AMP receptor protein